MTLDLSRKALEATFSELAHLLIVPARLTIEEEEAGLGIGGFGEVCLATLDKSSKSQRKVAVKQLRMVAAGVASRRIAYRLARELKIWAQVKHPNILELIGYYLSKNYVDAQFVSAFMVNGNVLQYMKRSQVGAGIRLKFVRDVTAGLTYLHDFSPPICHGDLKPLNVLINDNLDAVLCDFGVSSFIFQSTVASGLTTSHSIKGSPRYMSPELLLDEDPKYTLQSDIWAWGCTAFEIMTDTAPYSTTTNQALIMIELYNKIVPGSMDALNTVILGSGVDSACHTGVSLLRSIIPQCWDFDPTQRPLSSGILKFITIPFEAKAYLGAWDDQEGGTSSLRIGDDSRHSGSASQRDIAPYRVHSLLCMNCQQYPKVGGQEFCSKACRDDASRLPANAQDNASGSGFPWLNFGKLASRLTAKWEPILQENDIGRQDTEKTLHVVTKTIKIPQETASDLGKTADKDMASNPTMGGDYELGEGLRNTGQAKHAGANQATSSREKNQDSDPRTRPFNTLASQDPQSTEIAKGAQQSADPLKRAVKRYAVLRGLRQGLLSTSDKRSEPVNALDLSDKILEKPRPRTSGAFSDPIPETGIFTPRSDEHSQVGDLNRDSPLALSEGSEILGRSLDVRSSAPFTVSKPPQSLRHRLQKTIRKKSSGFFNGLRSTISRASSLGTAVTPRSRGGSTGMPLEMPQSPMPSTSRPPHLFSIEELQEGLVSDIGKRSEALDALDFTGQLNERTNLKSYGGFSEVTQAKLGNRLVAVKALRATGNGTAVPDESRMRTRLAREIYVWAELDHPYILKLLGFAFEDGKPCLVSPWCDNGTLLEYLERYPNADRRQLVRQIAEGLRYLHNQSTPIIHGDLKTANILVTEDHIPKIFDFGGSRHAEAGTGLTTAGLELTNIRYSAPEILEGSQIHSLQTDVYSFAGVTLETMSGKCPFWKIKDSIGVIPKVLYEKQTPSPEDHPVLDDPVLWDLLRRCWSHVPADRPTMTDICKLLSGVGNGASIGPTVTEGTSQAVIV